MPRTSTGSSPWPVRDSVDLEYLLSKDAAGDFTARWRADRAIFESLIQANAPEALARDRVAVFQSWLRFRRLEGQYLPGDDLTAAWKTIVSVMFLAAFFYGLLHAGALLVLEQDGHVSATRFFMLTVGLQLLLTLCGLALCFGRRALRTQFGAFESLRLKLATVLLRSRLVNWGHSNLRRALPLLLHRRGLYQRLVFGHIVLATQLCFIAMSAGIIVSLIAYHFAYRDVRFGWSTTHAWEAADISSAAGVVSTPWSWALPAAKPTLSQVAESHLSAETFGKRVSADASRAWAGFLVAALLFYGIALRVLIAGIAVHRVTRQRWAVKFSHPEGDELWLRLTTPLPEERTQAGPPPQPPKPKPRRRFSWPEWLWPRKRPVR
jgi:hypothetical protein